MLTAFCLVLWLMVSFGWLSSFTMEGRPGLACFACLCADSHRFFSFAFPVCVCFALLLLICLSSVVFVLLLALVAPLYDTRLACFRGIVIGCCMVFSMILLICFQRGCSPLGWRLYVSALGPFSLTLSLGTSAMSSHLNAVLRLSSLLQVKPR